MVLIADSGSTKTDWMLLHLGKQQMFRTSGINPYFLNEEAIMAVVSEDATLRDVAHQVRSLHFYGAGCTEKLHIEQVAKALRAFFPKSKVEVKTDMLGAARAVLGNSKGIAAILGTGSNSCAYDGENLVESVPSLGYLLGDEGSGMYIGRILIKSMLLNQIPPEIRSAFDKHFGLTQADIITATLSKPMPNRFLASFCEFFVNHLDDPRVRMLVQQAFRDFMNAHITEYDDYTVLPVGFVGSIAFFFQVALREVTSEFDIEDVIIMRSPIEALGQYHS
jgi:N-acetylglucosamine kinase-like BadF-type ATPase